MLRAGGRAAQQECGEVEREALAGLALPVADVRQAGKPWNGAWDSSNRTGVGRGSYLQPAGPLLQQTARGGSGARF